MSTYAGTYASTYGEVVPPPNVVREFPRDDLGLYIDRPYGPPVRIAGDEVNAPLADYSFASELDGGYSQADASVLRIAGDHGVRKHAQARWLLPDRREVWRGRVESTPESSDSALLGLSMIGHQALLEDTRNVTFLGVDSRLDGWEEPPRARRRASASGGSSTNAAFSMSVDEDGLTITMDADRNVQNTARGEAWYRGNDEKRISEVQYIASAVLTGANMATTIRSIDDPGGSVLDSATLDTSLAVTSWVPDDPAKYIFIRDTPTAQVNKPDRIVQLHAASMFGNHDLPRHAIEDLPDGLKFSDIIVYLIERFQRMLPVGTVDESSFVMAQAAWLDPSTLGDVLREGMALEHGRNWAVWDAFTYRRRQDMGKVWNLKRSDGARFVRAGEAAEPDVNGVLLVYSDKAGITRWAGPPGSGADVTDVSLRDSDPSNPVNASRVVGDRFLVVEADTLSNDRAVEVAQEALAEALKPRWVGEVEVPRFAERDGVREPTSLMRADDWVKDSEAGGETMPLSAVSYSRSGERPATASIDLPANRLDVALARQGLRPQRVRRSRIKRTHRRMRQKRYKARKQKKN